MTASPVCTALSSALQKKGWSYAQLASKIGVSEQHIVDICNGKQVPTHDEYERLAVALDIKHPIPHNTAHPGA